MKYILSLILLFVCSSLYAQAVGVPKNHNQLSGTGTNSHAIIDTFIASKGQANGVASLDADGNVIQPIGTTTIGMVKQTNGTASGTVLTSVSIVSGTGTLSNANLVATTTVSNLYSTDSIKINPVNRIELKINGNVVGILTSTGLSMGGNFAPSYSLDILGTTSAAGNIIQGSASSYHYFGGTLYGLRDNAGTMQFKNNGGDWGNIASSTSGGGWQDDGANIRPITVTDKVTIGSTTSTNRQLTCVGSSTFYGQVAIGSNTTITDGLSTFLDLAIGDNDTGLKWIQNGDYALYGNGDIQIKIDGNNDKVLIGTSTSGTKLNVGGTVTAEGFSGNGGELINLSIPFSAITGVPTDNAYFSATGTANKVPVGSSSNKLDYSWFPPGIQIGYGIGSSSVSNGTNTIIPSDNTIPQDSEGIEAFTVTYTPKLISSVLVVRANVHLTVNTGGVATVAMFKDALGNALVTGAISIQSPTNEIIPPISLVHKEVVTSLAPTTFKLRYGSQNAGNVAYINRGLSGDLYGGTLISTIEVFEYLQ